MNKEFSKIKSLMNIVHQDGDTIVKEIVPEIMRLPGYKNYFIINQELTNEPFFANSVKVRDNKFLYNFIEPSGEEKNINDFIEVIEHISRIHKVTDLELEEFNLLYEYKLLRKDAILPEWVEEDRIIESMKSIINYDKMSLCHNDLHPGNIHKSKKGMYIIDFDFAGVNDIMFDLARFMSQHNFNQEDRTKLINKYFEGKEKPSDKNFHIWEEYDNLFSAVWASAMIKRIGGKEFEDIYSSKISNLKEKPFEGFKYN